MRSNLFLLFLMTALFSACGGGSLDPVKVHEGAKDETSGAPIKGPVTTESSAKSDVVKAFANLNTLSSFKEEYLKITNWEDPTISTSDEFRKFIDDTHKALLQQPEKERRSELAAFYLTFCDEKLEKCKFVTTLRTSPYAASVVLDASLGVSEIQNKYRLILMAFDLNNSVFSNKNAKIFLNDIKSYRKYLVESNNNRLLSKIDGVVQILLARVQSGQLKTENDEWITSLSLVDSLDQNFNYLGGKHLTQNKDSEVVARPELVEEIAKTQKLDSSYSYKMKWLQENMPKLLTQFKIKPLELDPRFFIVEQLMLDRWSVKQASAFYHGAGLKLDAFPEIIRIYMTTQIVYLLGVSQTDLAQFFKESDRRDVINFFDDAKTRIRKSALLARALSQRVDKLMDFALQIDRQSKEAQEISSVKENFDKSLRVSLTVPLTFAIFDIGNRLGVSPTAQMPITKYYVGGKLPYETLLIKFFRGQLVPLLDFTLDMTASNPYETAEGIEFALRSGILEALGTTADEAMSRFIDLYLQTNALESYDVRSYVLPTKINLIQNEIEELEQIKKQASFNYQLSICESLKHPEKSGRRSLQFTEMIRSPSLGSQAFKFFNSGNSSGVTSSSRYRIDTTELSYNPILGPRIDALEHLRLDFLPTIEMFKSLVGVVEKNGIAMKTSKIRIEQTQAIFKKFATSFMNYYRLTFDCWRLMIEHERMVTAKVLDYERIYWKWAFERFKQGQPYGLSFGSNLPQGIEYRARFNKSNLVTFNFDLFIRARTYISQGLPELNLPPIEPKLNIIFNEGLKSKDIYKESLLNSVPFPDASNSASDEFANQAMKSTGFNSKDGIEWARVVVVPEDFLESYIHAFALFYRISPFLKQTLEIDQFYTAQNVIEDHLKIIKFVNLKDYEINLLKALGRHSFFSLKVRGLLAEIGIVPQWILDISNKAIPILDLFLKQLPGKWMSSYGRKDIYENPLNDPRTKRPENLQPYSDQAVKLFYYLNELNQGHKHLFFNSVDASQQTIAYYTRLFKDDSKNLNDFIADIHKTPSAKVLVDIDIGELDLQNYSPVFVENLSAKIEKFNQDTGGIFRAQ